MATINPNQAGNGTGTAGNLTAAYLDSADALNKLEIDGYLVDRYSDFGGAGLLNWLESQGNFEESGQNVFYHGEKNWLFLGQKIASSVVSGSKVAITIHADSLDAGVAAPRVSEIIMFPSGVTAYVDAVAGAVITVQPQTGTSAATLAAEATVGTYFSLLSNAQIEGSSNMTSYVSKPLIFQGNTQIFREAFDMTGTAASNKSYFTSRGGKPYYYIQQEMDAVMRLRHKINFGMIFQPAAAFTDASGTAAPTSTGLIPIAKQDGISYNTAVGGSFTIDDIEAINLALDAENAGNSVQFWIGNQLNQELQRSVTDTMQMSVSYGTFKGGKDRALELGFNSIKIGQRQWDVNVSGIFHHPQITGLAGMNHAMSGILLPTDSMIDTVTGKKESSISMCYKKQGDGQDRRYRFGKIDFDTNLQDKISTGYMAEMGLKVRGRNRLCFVQG